jgi:hypothetical protein
MVAQGLERAMMQLEKAWDSLDSGKPDHDIIRDRIASAMAAAQVKRIQLMEQMLKDKQAKLIT